MTWPLTSKSVVSTTSLNTEVVLAFDSISANISLAVAPIAVLKVIVPPVFVITNTPAPEPSPLSTPVIVWAPVPPTIRLPSTTNSSAPIVVSPFAVTDLPVAMFPPLVTKVELNTVFWSILISSTAL